MSFWMDIPSSLVLTQIAVGYLHDLMEVAGLKDAVQGRVTFYRNQVQQVQEGL